MKVLLLTGRYELLAPAISATGDTTEYLNPAQPPSTWPRTADFIVSFGYRHIIQEPQLSIYRGRMVNIHISLLPWNRGADPNFWSWFDDTPKGVTVHEIDRILDSGSIFAWSRIEGWPPGATLATTYNDLITAGGLLFRQTWPSIRNQTGSAWHPPKGGSFHTKADGEPFISSLQSGWETPVEEVVAMGRVYRESKRGEATNGNNDTKLHR